MSLGPIRRRAAEAGRRAGVCPACGRAAGRDGADPDAWADDPAFAYQVALVWRAGIERLNRAVATRAPEDPALRGLVEAALGYIHVHREEGVFDGPA